MFFAVRVNNAIALLGLDPRVISAEYRQGAQLVGKLSGSSPQEVALFIVSQLPIAYRLDLNPLPVKTWIRKKKLNPKDPEMVEALYRLGWEQFMDYS